MEFNNMSTSCKSSVGYVLIPSYVTSNIKSCEYRGIFSKDHGMFHHQKLLLGCCCDRLLGGDAMGHTYLKPITYRHDQCLSKGYCWKKCNTSRYPIMPRDSTSYQHFIGFTMNEQVDTLCWWTKVDMKKLPSAFALITWTYLIHHRDSMNLAREQIYWINRPL